MALNLLSFIHKDDRLIPELKLPWYKRVSHKISGWVSTDRLHTAILISLTGLGLISFKEPASYLLDRWIGSPAWVAAILNVTAGRHIDISAAPELANVRMILEMCVGTVFLIAAVLMLFNQNKNGIFLALTGLVISFTSTNVLVFYFEQFSTMIMVTVQFITLLGLIEYRHRLPLDTKGSSFSLLTNLVKKVD